MFASAIQQCESAVCTHRSLPWWTSPPSPHPSVVTEPHAEVPVPYNSFPLAICYTRGRVYVSMLKDFPPLFLLSWSEEVRLLQSCPTLCDPMDCSPPGSSVHEILQARILEWVAMPSSTGSSWPKDWTHVSCIEGRFFTAELPGKPQRVSKDRQSWQSGFHPSGISCVPVLCQALC